MDVGEIIGAIGMIFLIGLLIGLPCLYFYGLSTGGINDETGILLSKYEANGTYYVEFPRETYTIGAKYYNAMQVGQQYNVQGNYGNITDVDIPYNEGL